MVASELCCIRVKLKLYVLFSDRITWYSPFTSGILSCYHCQCVLRQGFLNRIGHELEGLVCCRRRTKILVTLQVSELFRMSTEYGRSYSCTVHVIQETWSALQAWGADRFWAAMSIGFDLRSTNQVCSTLGKLEKLSSILLHRGSNNVGVGFNGKAVSEEKWMPHACHIHNDKEEFDPQDLCSSRSSRSFVQFLSGWTYLTCALLTRAIQQPIAEGCRAFLDRFQNPRPRFSSRSEQDGSSIQDMGIPEMKVHQMIVLFTCSTQ